MSLFDRVLNPPSKIEEKTKTKKNVIQSTAGAVPVKNVKGDITMETVKVKSPEYAIQKQVDSDIVDSDLIDLPESPQIIKNEKPRSDHGRRKIFEPQVVTPAESLPEQTKLDEEEKSDQQERGIRRQELRERLLKEQQNTYIETQSLNPSHETEILHEEEESSSEEEGTSSSEEEETVPRGERVTVQDEDEEFERQTQLQIEEEEQKKKETKELISRLSKQDLDRPDEDLDPEGDVNTDDDDEETAFEEWKIRELKRIKRDFEEAEAAEAEKQERLKLRVMTEEERTAHLEANPRVITNKPEKGTYKFLQKYYHRGAFYLDQEENVLKQDFAQPTLEDHFDKSTLPSVMQVKNFGKKGRTKYTHLVDQDTSCFIGPWSKKNELAGTFPTKIGGGLKQTFDRPSSKRKKYA